MRRFRHAFGFTLVEVGLAITVGTVLVAAGVFLYHQARESAGDTAARQRVADLQVLVEHQFTTNGFYPDDCTVSKLWDARSDALRSPWGGEAEYQGITNCSGSAAFTTGLFGRPLTSSNFPNRQVGSDTDDTSQYSDIVYYYLLDPGAPAQPDGWELWDASLQDYADPVSGYAIAHNKRHKVYYFVRGGR